MSRKRKKPDPVRLDNWVIVSDLHCGCGHAVCHPDGLTTDEGGTVMPSPDQRELWKHWRAFWDEWVPEITHGEPFGIVNAGDSIDGVHHKSVTQMTHNLVAQCAHAEKVLRPEVARAAVYIHLRGTEVHSGESGQQEEMLAERLGALPDEGGRHSRYEVWFRIGDDKWGGLGHVMHHIGTTGSSHYESSAVMRELTEAFVEAGRWGDEPPRVVVRAHRHRHIQVRIPGGGGDCIGCVTPGWQLKTPFAYRIAGGRVSQPQVGGIAVRFHKREIYVRNMVARMERPKEVDFVT